MPLPIRQYLALMDMLARFQLKAEARRFLLGYLWWIVRAVALCGCILRGVCQADG